jgi:hypothetical protein
MSEALASSRLASRISSMSWSSSPMLRVISSRAARRRLGSISSRPMRMRASGERSSCEALASSDLCERTSVSTRSADG